MAKRTGPVTEEDAPTVPLNVGITPRLLDRLDAYLYVHRKDRPRPGKASVTRAALDRFLLLEKK